MNVKNIQRLDLNLLRVFQTLFWEQNMTRTAEILHITPSAVSHSISRLRDALDDPLFVRSQNKMLPTPACQRMAPSIIESLAQLQQLLQQWGSFEPASSEYNFRVGMHDAMEPSIVPKLAAKLAKLAPYITFSSIKIDRRNLSNDLTSGNLDMAIDIALAVEDAINYEKLATNTFIVLMRHEHPLAGTLNKKSYLESSHLNVSNRTSGLTIEDTMFQEAGLKRKTTIRCQNHFAAKEILKNSDQLLTTPQLLGEQLLDNELRIEPLPFRSQGFSTHLYWHQNTKNDAALSWFRSIINSLFANPSL